jgi:transaldolase
MKLFIDTANLAEIEEVISKGIVQGITTNPSLLAKEPKADFYSHIQKICDLCKKYDLNIPVSVEVFAVAPSEMVAQGSDIISAIDYNNINIKIPVGFNEMKAVNELYKKGIPVNCTCCFSATQMQVAALAGARYVSLFYNRALDAQIDALETLHRTRKFIDANNLECEIIAGSIRNAYDLEDCWDAGCNIVTAGLPVIKKSVAHLKTDESVDGFLKDFAAWM